MPHLTVNQNLYEIFGVAEDIQKLNKEELAKLDETLSKFILVKGIEDLSAEAKQKLITQKFTDGKDLYLFFSQQIPNFQIKLKDYGNEFRNTIITNRT